MTPPSSTALDIASATSAFTTSTSSAPDDDVNIGRRTAELCPSFISTWGVDGLHFTEYTTWIPCVVTPAWTSFATDTPTHTQITTTAASAQLVQDVQFQQLHDKFLGVVIAVPIFAAMLIAAVFLWGKTISKAEKRRLRAEALEERRGESRARIEELEQRNAELQLQLDQAQLQAQVQAGGAANTQGGPTT